MQVRIRYFGVLKDITGCALEMMEVPAGGTVGDVLRLTRTRWHGSGVWETLAVAVNQEYAQAAMLLEDGDEIALLPPVSGGAE